jgi:hypothetical protein
MGVRHSRLSMVPRLDPCLAELSALVAYDRQLFDTAQIVPPDEVGIVRFMISRTCP